MYIKIFILTLLSLNLSSIFSLKAHEITLTPLDRFHLYGEKPAIAKKPTTRPQSMIEKPTQSAPNSQKRLSLGNPLLKPEINIIDTVPPQLLTKPQPASFLFKISDALIKTPQQFKNLKQNLTQSIKNLPTKISNAGKKIQQTINYYNPRYEKKQITLINKSTEIAKELQKNNNSIQPIELTKSINKLDLSFIEKKFGKSTLPEKQALYVQHKENIEAANPENLFPKKNILTQESTENEIRARLPKAPLVSLQPNPISQESLQTDAATLLDFYKKYTSKNESFKNLEQLQEFVTSAEQLSKNLKNSDLNNKVSATLQVTKNLLSKTTILQKKLEDSLNTLETSLKENYNEKKLNEINQDSANCKDILEKPYSQDMKNKAQAILDKIKPYIKQKEELEFIKTMAEYPLKNYSDIEGLTKDIEAARTIATSELSSKADKNLATNIIEQLTNNIPKIKLINTDFKEIPDQKTLHSYIDTLQDMISLKNKNASELQKKLSYAKKRFLAYDTNGNFYNTVNESIKTIPNAIETKPLRDWTHTIQTFNNYLKQPFPETFKEKITTTIVLLLKQNTGHQLTVD